MVYEFGNMTMFFIIVGVMMGLFFIIFIAMLIYSFRFRKAANKRAKERGYDSFTDMSIDKGMQMTDKSIDMMDQAVKGKATININHTGNGSEGNTVIKVRCPQCGYLESEDSIYCSKCGRSMKQGC